jgi:hypothetical protein
MITVQAGDIFASVPIDGFDKILFGMAALVAAAAWHPEVMAYLRRAPTHPNAEEIHDHPLQMRTLLLSMSGALVAAGILTAIAPRRSVFALIFVAGCVGAAATASVWTGLVLVPLGAKLPDGEPPEAAVVMLRRMGRSPWHRVLLALTWSTVVGAAIGAAIVLYRVIRTGESTHALPIVELCTIGAIASGYVFLLSAWAGSVGEYARTGIVPPVMSALPSRPDQPE